MKCSIILIGFLVGISQEFGESRRASFFESPFAKAVAGGADVFTIPLRGYIMKNFKMCTSKTPYKKNFRILEEKILKHFNNKFVLSILSGNGALLKVKLDEFAIDAGKAFANTSFHDDLEKTLHCVANRVKVGKVLNGGIYLTYAFKQFKPCIKKSRGDKKALKQIVGEIKKCYIKYINTLHMVPHQG